MAEPSKLRLPPVVALSLMVVALTAGCNRGAPATSDAPAPVSITTAKATSRDVPVYLTASGSILADETTEVAALVAGVVADTPVDIGTYLDEGTVIVTLDDHEARLNLRQATAGVTEAEAAVASARTAAVTARSQATLATQDEQGKADLFAKGGISRNAYNQAVQQKTAAIDNAEAAELQVVSSQASLTSAKARAELSQRALDNTRIRAPFAGFLSLRNAAKGEFVAAGTSVAQVARLDPVQVVVQVPEVDMPMLAVGLDATASVAAHPDKTFAGKVSAVSPVVDPYSRSVTTKIGFANPDSSLRPGMFATVRIARSQTESAVFVPATAVSTDPNTGSAQVYVIRDGEAALQIVQLGATSGDQVRILNGVAAGAEVATNNLAQLRDGAKVTTGS